MVPLSFRGGVRGEAGGGGEVCSLISEVKPDGYYKQQWRNTDERYQRNPEIQESLKEMFIHVLNYKL